MAVQTFRAHPLVRIDQFGTGQPTTNMNASTTRAAIIFCADRTASIDRVIFRTGTVTTSQPMRVSIQTVNATTGFPTGTPVGTAGTSGALSASTWYEITLGSNASLTEGTLYAVVVEWDSATGSIQVLQSISSGANGIPGDESTAVFYNSGSWATTSNTWMLSARYTDDAYITAAPYIATSSTQAYNSGSAPNEYGVKWTPTRDWRVRGIACHYSAVASSAHELRIYNSSSVQQATVSGYLESAMNHIFRLNTTVQVTAGGTYYLALKPTNANNVTLSRGAFRDTYARAASSLTEFVQVSRTDTGAWTEDDTIVPFMVPVIDGIDSGGGGTTVIVIED
jgi:hypothetical protein